MNSTGVTRTALRAARIWSIVAVVLLGAVTAPAAATSPVAQTQGEADAVEPAFVVALHENGTADVAVTTTFDLDDADEREAFDSLRDDGDAQQNAAVTFAVRLGSVAANASERVDREMRVSNPSVSLSTADDGSVGVVRFRVRWHGLAAVSGDDLRVSEPFASGFAPDRPFTVVGPDGYGLADATPSASETADGGATWSADTDLDGFSATFEPGAGDDGALADAQPGFGPVAALVALGAGLVLFSRRRTAN